LSACWDKVELEERAYVISIGIDKNEDDKDEEDDNDENDKNDKNDAKDEDGNDEDNKNDEDDKDEYVFLVSMAMPDLAQTGKDSGEEQVKTAIGRTIHSAIGSTDGFSGKKLYFGHTKLVVLNEEILKNERLLRETIDAFERNDQISGRAIVLSTQSKAEKVLDTNPPAESMVGIFVSSFFRSGHNTAGAAFKQDLTGVIRDLRAKGSTVIPEIKLKGKELEIGGGALISDFELEKWLTEDEMRGYLWTQNGKISGTVIEIESSDTFLPLKISKHKARTTFSEADDVIICQIDIKAEGVLESFIFGENPPELENLAKQYERLILDEVVKSDEAIDFFEFELFEQMRRRNNDLLSDFEAGKKDTKVKFSVEVKIVRTGNLIQQA